MNCTVSVHIRLFRVQQRLKSVFWSKHSWCAITGHASKFHQAYDLFVRTYSTFDITSFVFLVIFNSQGATFPLLILHYVTNKTRRLRKYLVLMISNSTSEMLF